MPFRNGGSNRGTFKARLPGCCCPAKCPASGDANGSFLWRAGDRAPRDSCSSLPILARTASPPWMRCPIRVGTECSISSGRRRSVKQAAKRSTSRRTLLVCPSKSAPASDVIVPPSKLLTTLWPSTRAKSNCFVLHSCRHRGVRASLNQKLSYCSTTTFL